MTYMVHLRYTLPAAFNWHSNMVRVAFVHLDLGIGGAERLICDAALALQKKGHNVVLFTSHHDSSHCFKETKDGTLEVKWWLATSTSFGKILCFLGVCADDICGNSYRLHISLRCRCLLLWSGISVYSLPAAVWEADCILLSLSWYVVNPTQVLAEKVVSLSYRFYGTIHYRISRQDPGKQPLHRKHLPLHIQILDINVTGCSLSVIEPSSIWWRTSWWEVLC